MLEFFDFFGSVFSQIVQEFMNNPVSLNFLNFAMGEGGFQKITLYNSDSRILSFPCFLRLFLYDFGLK